MCVPVIPFSSAHLTSAAAYFVWRHKKRQTKKKFNCRVPATLPNCF